MPFTLNKYQIEKLGNTLIYLSNHVGDFSKTKALKLLFLLEEKSIAKYGVPFFGFEFKVWQYGPVNEYAYFDLSSEDFPLLHHYIKKSNYDASILEANAEFNDDEFSENDLAVLEEIIKFSKNKTAKDLVEITHGENSLWKASAIENGVLNAFEKKEITKTDILIDFSRLLQDEYLKERYNNSVEFLKFTTQINS